MLLENYLPSSSRHPKTIGNILKVVQKTSASVLMKLHANENEAENEKQVTCTS